MIAPLVLALLSSATPSRCDRSPVAPVGVVAMDSTLQALYASGVDYRTFLGAAQARRAQWEAVTAKAVVPADALAAARAVPGRYRLLAVALDGCSDSVNTIPYLARLVEQVPTLELRVVLPGPGAAIMEAHRTPDGRPATPTLVVLDEAGREVGCWVERPSMLQTNAIRARSAGTIEVFQRDKQAWYDSDAGASTIREVVAVLQAAGAGTPRCDALTGPLPKPASGQ